MVTRHRSIAVLIFDDVNLIDVAGPAEAFHETRNYGMFHYDLRYFSITNNAVRASCGLILTPNMAWNDISTCDDILITGGVGIDKLLPHKSLKILVSRWQEEHPWGRVLSVCSGALLLANAGVLEGKLATTHWRRSVDAQRFGRKVLWDFDKIYTCDGNVFCSAGITAGIDLALHIISLDAGRRIASNVARELVVPMQRAGGQSQHSLLLEFEDMTNDRLRPLIDKIIQKPNHNWTLDELAHSINLTPRTLSRRTKKELGVPPVKFVEIVRLQFAINLIEEGGQIDAIARKTGFGSSQRLNRAIKRNCASTPSQLMRVLHSDHPGIPIQKIRTIDH